MYTCVCACEHHYAWDDISSKLNDENTMAFTTQGMEPKYIKVNKC